MLEAVIFDMDGVIIDSEPIHHALEKEEFESVGLKISDAEHNSFVGTTSKMMWSTLKEKYNLQPTVDELVEEGKKRFVGSIKSGEVQPIEGIRELIEDLYKNKIKVALASSGAKESIETVLSKFQIRQYFDVVVSGDEVENGKPAPDIFLEASKRLKVDPAKCVVIEDSKHGVEAANLAGMKSVGFKNPNSFNQDVSRAAMTVDHITELSYDRLSSFYSQI